MQEYFFSDILTDAQAKTATESNHQADNTAPAADSQTEDLTTGWTFGTPNSLKYFEDSVEGFGEWKILLSTRCEQCLRQYWRREAKRFEIVKKKIT